MSSWSRNRKILYGGTTTIIIVIIVVSIGLKLFYKAPTCSDGLKNGDEKGVDCGGSCAKLCQSAFFQPIVSWTRFEETAPHFYNVATYIVNPNIDGIAYNVPYRVQLYDDRGILITEYNRTVTLPPHRNTIAFEGAVDLQERIPAKALFEFTGAPEWKKQSDTLASIFVQDKQYSEEENTSTLLVKIKNSSAENQGQFTAYVVLYDKNNNALGFSKTIVDGIDAGQTITAPFTWPVNRNGAVISIEVLPVAE